MTSYLAPGQISVQPIPASSTLTCTLRDGVGIISLNRPDTHNAINEELRAALRDAYAWASSNPAVRAILVRGNGRSFCSGRDTHELGHRPGNVSDEDYIDAVQTNRLRQFEITKPIVAAVHGAVLGAGAEMALAADFRVSGDSLKFCLPEIHYGLVADTGASVFVTELAGPSRAKWLLMSGDPIDAQTALAWGLVDWLVPMAELDDKAMEIAAKLASRPPRALAHGKRLIDEQIGPRLRSGLRRELLAQCVLFGGVEYKELAAARKAKRRGREASKGDKIV